MRLRSPVSINLLPMRDHRTQGEHVPRTDARYVMSGYRMVKRGREESPVPLVTEGGDWNNAFFIPPDSTIAPTGLRTPVEDQDFSRPCGSWFWGAIAGAAGKEIKGGWPFFLMLDDEGDSDPFRIRADTRYAKLIGTGVSYPTHQKIEANTTATPDGIEVMCPSLLPSGFPGIITVGSSDTQQQLFFLPSGNMLVSHWRNQADMFSTHVMDSDEEQLLIDTKKPARLGSFFRLTDIPIERGAGSGTQIRGLAWNCAVAPDPIVPGKAMANVPGVGKGLAVFRPLQLKDGTVKAVLEKQELPPAKPGDTEKRSFLRVTKELLNAWMAMEGGGPLAAGGGKCQHVYTINSDGEKFVPGHLGAHSLFWAGDSMCASLAFELRDHPGAGQYPYNAEVHLVYDRGAQHPWLAGNLSDLRVGTGLWRWYAEVTFGGPDDGDGGDITGKEPKKGGGGGGPERKIPKKKRPPTGGGGGKDGGGGGGGGDDSGGGARRGRSPLTAIQFMWSDEKMAEEAAKFAKDNPTIPRDVRILRSAEEKERQFQALQKELGGGVAIPPGTTFIEEEEKREAKQTVALHKQYPAATWLELGMESISFRPVRSWIADENIRLAKRTTVDQMATVERAPATARIEAFGAVTTARIPVWDTTHSQASESTRKGTGTGPGGIAVLPPELSLGDVRVGVFSDIGDNRAVSTTYMAMIRTRLAIVDNYDQAAGIPVKGFVLRPVDGNLQVDAVDADGTVTPTATFNSNGDVSFSGNVTVTSKLTVGGLIDPTGLELEERAANPGSASVTTGTVWLRNDAPLMFTDRAGDDFVFGGVGAGGGHWNVRAITGTATAAFGDHMQCTSAPFTVTAPNITAADIGRSIQIKNASAAQNITVDGNGSDTFNNANDTTILVQPGMTLTLMATTTIRWDTI